MNLISPASELEGQPVTGGTATISGNTIGLVSGSQAADPAIQRGVYTWSGADDVTVSANTIGGATDRGIELSTGARHKITGNKIGTDVSGAIEVPVRIGVSLADTSDVTIGGTGSDANKIVADSVGVNIDNTATTTVAGNTVTGSNSASGFIGVYVDENSTGVTLDSNVLNKGSIGVRNDTADTTITKNTVSKFTDFGIKSRGDDVTVTGNVSSGNGVGISASGKDLNVSLNRVGLDGATDTVIGNTGRGIDIGEASTVELTRNIVAGSGEQGVYVINGSTATLRANRILSTTGRPIDAAGAPAAPNLVGAARATNGTSTRTTLLLADLPKGDAGTIEVFANESCSDPEAEIVMDITRTKKVDEEVRIIQIMGNATRDNYTVTYTDAGGHTSELSGCAEAKTYGDADGDGSQDPFDAILGQKDDPTKALIPTDTEELLFIGTAPFDEESGEGGGDLSDIAVIDDPAPGTHPTDWKLPYGVISFRINGLEPGAATSVAMTTITDASPLAGTSYWKYGSPSAGAPARWYKFDFDEATGTGAQLSDAHDVPGIGIRRSFVLNLRDGARGDNDGGANGTITDPGGPVIGGDTDTPPPVPTGPTAPPATTPPATNTPTEPAPTGGGATIGGVVTSPGAGATSPAPSSSNTTGTLTGGPLAFTGNNPLALLLVAAALMLMGTITTRRQRRIATRKTT